MTPQTQITVSFPEIDADDIETTWQDFVSDNDDADMLADVERQIGGGGAPLTWVFAA